MFRSRDNGKLVLQGKKEQRETFARKLKGYTEQEKTISEAKYDAEIANDPYLKNEGKTRRDTENTRSGG